jgi:hypothetical protein
MGTKDSDLLADQLFLLMEGAQVSSRIREHACRRRTSHAPRAH